MDSVQVPEWLTKDFLQTCLESDKAHFPKVYVSSFIVESAVPPGNNYGSLMLRVKVQHKVPSKSMAEESINIIVKAPLTKGLGDMTLEVFEGISALEPRYYNEFISETYKLMDHDVVPRCYKSPYAKCLVMEDLKSSGFVMVDRTNLLDYDHCVMFAEESSKLHALSVVLRGKTSSLIESIQKPDELVKEGMNKMMNTLAFNGLRAMSAYLKDKPDHKEFLDIINILIEKNILWDMCSGVEQTERPLMAITQGDPWCTNMMFKYNSMGRVDAIKILDFQFLKYTSPVVEFVYFLSMSANLDVRRSRFSDLYRIYSDSLNSNLTQLGSSQRLSHSDLMAEVKSMSPLVFFTYCCSVPHVIHDEEIDPSSFSEVESSKPIKETALWKRFEGANFDKYYPEMLDIIKNEGFLADMKERVQNIGQRK